MKEEIKTQDQALSRSNGGCRGVLVGQRPHLRHDRHGEGLHAARQGVGASPRAVQGREAKVDVAMACQARVRGPHSGARLPHRSYCVLHRPRADRVAAGSNGAGAIPVGEELKQGDGVSGAQMPGVHSEGSAEGLPEAPAGIGRGCALPRNPSNGWLLLEERTSQQGIGVGWQVVHHPRTCLWIMTLRVSQEVGVR